jgi:NAD+ synthase (glutamine-hydrolysing)
VYCNQVGGNDELVFDGNSCVVDANGDVIAQAKDFESDLLVVDLPIEEKSAKPQAAPDSRMATPKVGLEAAYHALVLGLRDYCRKCGFKSIVLGLSGGIDSALCAALAVAALGKENVRGVAMPSRFSSEHSVNDARDLAERLGIKFHTISIEKPHAAFEELLTPHFEGLPRDATEENVQARIRGVLMMALSNKFGALLLTTGNKSEMAVGYCTLYGDMAGGLAVISDVFKTQVYALARWINREREIIPPSTIEKPPSAELRPGQVDQDSLPPYDVLDAILKGYVEEGLSRADLVARGFSETVVNDVVRKVDLNEYKRKQAAPGLKTTPLAFGVGRRIPIVQKYVS